MLTPLNAWIGELFDSNNVDRTVAALVASQDADSSAQTSARPRRIKERLNEAEARLRRLRDAIEASVDPAALVEAINQAHAQRAAARAELEAAAPAPDILSDAEVYAMIDSLGDVGHALKERGPPLPVTPEALSGCSLPRRRRPL